MKKGFTLIELLVVISIIGVLSSTILGSLSDARASARDARRQLDIKNIQTALEIYYTNNGEYPVTNGWRLPHTWDNFETEIGMNLPRDPSDESAYPYNGGLSYAYYTGTGFSIGCTPGQWYMLVYNQERTIDPTESGGVTRCSNGTNLAWGNNSITVGVTPADN